VNELEEAEIEWQLVLRDAPVWTEPGALHPIRLKNFADPQLGTSLVRIEDGWWIVLGPTDTKAGRADERQVAAFSRADRPPRRGPVAKF
jgi:hypothetical protein